MIGYQLVSKEERVPTALISVSDKTGLVEFAAELANLGWQLLASGGTARVLQSAGVSVQEVSDYTSSPQILGGRVKTLHPAVHGGILARNTTEDLTNLEKIHARIIDMVVVNLYPFQNTISTTGCTYEQAVESIDIGGVALIRAAAKNAERVTVVTSPADYQLVLGELADKGSVSAEERHHLSIKAFQHTAAYDTAIAGYLQKQFNSESPIIPDYLAGFSRQKLRYGENPHQEGWLINASGSVGPLGGNQLQGKELSYTNLLDLDASWKAVCSFDRPTVCIVKHLSPCGIACADTIGEAYQLALECDPISAFGGIIASNQPIDESAAALMSKLFVECLIAPGFTPQALNVLTAKKNLRVINMPSPVVSPKYEVRSINNGLLLQSLDQGDPGGIQNWRVATNRQPGEAEMKSLIFAWKACRHVKSNAIVLASGESTVGIGGGQPNRVDCVRIAVSRAGSKSNGSVMASDAFFPFPDSVELAIKAGITAIVHPGGSVRDQESIDLANEAGLAMVLTGCRHFRH